MGSDSGKNLHADHRKRVRDRFLAGGLSDFPDHNVLELALFYALPYGDTNETAHRLLDTFGSLSGVLDSPFEELVKVKGVGSYAATFLSLLPQLAKRYYIDRLPSTLSIDSKETLYEFLCARYMNEKSEGADLLCFNSVGALTNCCRISLGTINHVLIDKRTLLETAFRNNASSVMLSHCHPDGIAAPSKNDIETTKSVVHVFDGVGVKIVDHIIVAGGEAFSMAESPRFCSIFV